MPIGGALITGGAALGGSVLSGKAQNKATKAQAKATEDALNYTKQKDTQSRADNERAYQVYQQQFNAWNKMRNTALAKYGFSGSMPDMSMMPDAGGIAGPQPQGGSVVGSGGAQPQMAPGAGAAQPGVPARASLADIIQSKGGRPEDTFDWRSMGLA